MIKIHFIWLGDKIPDWALDNFNLWEKSFDCTLHRNLHPNFINIFGRLVKSSPNLQSTSDLYRVWLVERLGGFYVDCDTRPLIDSKQFEVLAGKGDYLAGLYAKNKRVLYSNYLIGNREVGSPLCKETMKRYLSIALQDADEPMPFHLEQLWGVNLPSCSFLPTINKKFGDHEVDGAVLVHDSIWEPYMDSVHTPMGVIQTTLVSDEEYAIRQLECGSCEFMMYNDVCKKCGCSGKNKSRIATVHCPIDKW